MGVVIKIWFYRPCAEKTQSAGEVSAAGETMLISCSTTTGSWFHVNLCPVTYFISN